MKVVISGYGKMGHAVEQVLRRKGIEPALATDDIRSVDPALAAESVCIDFTTPDAFRENYAFIAEHFKAAAVGTTGWYDIRESVFEAFRRSGSTLVWASNFSIGVNAFFAAVRRACEVLEGHGYTPSVEETHHIHKLDAPSGTAKILGEIISDSLGTAPEITSHRIGEVPGIHTATFVSEADKLVFTHEAFSREGFAEGAVTAALLAEDKETGIYEFKDLIL